MKEELVEAQETSLLLNQENLQNASALLALLHGKSDSICRLFRKEIVVGRNDLSSLNEMMVSKLQLHNVSVISTSIDVTFSNKKIISFKSWSDFELYDFTIINSATKSVFIQWDFFATLKGYQVPQRHTVSIRIASTPNPSDVFKVLLSGGFDETHDFDIQSATMLCKVDFINNTLAEELVNVAETWNDLCECAYSSKGKVRPFLQLHRNGIAHIFEICLTFSLALIVAIALKVVVFKGLLAVTNQVLLYALVAVIPLFSLVRNLAQAGGKWIYNAFGDLMDIHIFRLSKGDEKEIQRIGKRSEYGKELVVFVVNTLVSVILSLVFYWIG